VGWDTFSHFMRIGVPRENTSGEHRVALVPEVVSKLKAKGLDVVIQSGAGADALLSDTAFTDAGAQVSEDAAEVWRSDVVVTIAPPDPQAIRGLGTGSILIGFLAPLTSPQTTRALADAKATAFAMEAIPRISRAQSMDALSSQSNVAGYRAALLGAEEMGRFYPMLMTAAGTIPPAKVLVLGVGVAGLQALATAKRLGARTTGYDVRPEVAEQVQSLGAMWLDLGLEAREATRAS
jgi:H+-translocating NAD(P) transhydrogenase subunit alpha